MSELQDMLCVQARLHRKQGANALGDLFENALNEIELLKKTYNQLFDAVQGEREQLAKANERVKELESYNVKLANESHEYQQLCAELEKQRETDYEVWQSKYQALKDSLSLTTCYECGTRVHELSPRSRCCMCEYGRAQFNERENEQLRREQEGE